MVPVRQLGFFGPDMTYVVEPGAFKVWIGPNSITGLEGGFEVV
jgi:beta-glucosidase